MSQTTYIIIGLVSAFGLIGLYFAGLRRMSPQKDRVLWIIAAILMIVVVACAYLSSPVMNP